MEVPVLAMGFGRKQNEDVIVEQVIVWECSSSDCNCWIRDNFKSTEEPTCPRCNSSMIKTERELQVIKNTSVFASRKG